MTSVHDCFLFMNELDVLELRLLELDQVVDRFVLVEARSTFSGREKPLVFAENRARFTRWLPRLQHVVLEELLGDDPWAREAYQRDALLRGLEDAAPDDVVLVSDVDEVPRPEAIQRFIRSGEELAALELDFFYYRLNCKNVRGTPHNPWSVIARRRSLRSPQAARRANNVLPRLERAGWHFSCMGDESEIRLKIESFSHQELNQPRFTAEAEIRRRVQAGLDLFDRPGFEWRYVSVDDSFPRCVQEDPARFQHLVAPVSPPERAPAAPIGQAPGIGAAPKGPRLLLLYHHDPTTTAAYLEAALRRCARVTTAGAGQEVPLPRERVVLPELLDRLGTDFDAVLEVQGDSVDVVGQEHVSIPCAWWAIDSHLFMSYGHHFFRAKAFDHVFVAQKHHVARYRDWAWTSSSWLPLAADPAVFFPMAAERRLDVGFVGNVLPGLHEARRRLLGRIFSRYARVGIARGLWRQDVSHFAARCRLVFNRSLHEDVNMRVFELLACGRPLLTDRLPPACGLEELFQADQHLVLYEDADLEPTLERWLADPVAAELLAAAGREHVLAHHTYDHRAREVLRVLGLGTKRCVAPAEATP